MKKILVPMAVVQLQDKTIAPLHFARATYIKKLVKYGLMPVFVSSIMTEEMLSDAYSQCSVLFMGGSDFNPQTYNEEALETTQANEPARDDLELFLLGKVMADKKPYIGICRGCQALNIANGGTLYRHIPDIVKEEQHGIGEGKTYDDLALNPKHVVTLKSDSKAFSLMNTPTVMVNSGHHQSVKEVGKNLTVSGVSPEGIVEVIESTDTNHFCFGIQSHPEAENTSFFEEIFEAFGEAVKEYVVPAGIAPADPINAFSNTYNQVL
jgi:putative glutamine amidotransferase